FGVLTQCGGGNVLRLLAKSVGRNGTGDELRHRKARRVFVTETITLKPCDVRVVDVRVDVGREDYDATNALSVDESQQVVSLSLVTIPAIVGIEQERGDWNGTEDELPSRGRGLQGVLEPGKLSLPEHGARRILQLCDDVGLLNGQEIS